LTNTLTNMHNEQEFSEKEMFILSKAVLIAYMGHVCPKFFL